MKIPQFARGVIKIIIFFAISAATVLYALGYKINYQTKSIQQTGIIKTNSVQNFDAEAFVNDAKVSDKPSFREAYVFPGKYDLTIKKDGYQENSYHFEVVKNKVVYIPAVLLVYTNPKQVALDDYYVAFENKAKTTLNPNLIKNENELWVADKYVTRFSKSIVTASEFPDSNHTILQLGNQLVILENDGRNAHSILTVEDDTTPIQYIYKDSGRVIQYYDGKVLKSIELYGK